MRMISTNYVMRENLHATIVLVMNVIQCSTIWFIMTNMFICICRMWKPSYKTAEFCISFPFYPGASIHIQTGKLFLTSQLLISAYLPYRRCPKRAGEA